MTRIERAFAILLLLSDGAIVSATELARRFEVSVRTIYRDVEMLSLTGVPVYAERGAAGGYRLQEGYFLPPVSLLREEAVALLLALALARGLRVAPFAAALDSAEKKLVAALPKHLHPLLAETRRLIGFERAAKDVFHAEPPSGPDDAASHAVAARAVEIFLKAVLDGTRVRFTYRSPYYEPAEGAAEVEADPQGLLWDRELWYLVGRRRKGVSEPGAADQRMWRADRVLAIAPSTFRAAASRDFDVRRQLGRRWLASAMTDWVQSSPVRIRMTEAQAERLRADWYFEFAHFAEEDEGRVVMSYGENRRDLVFELVRWLGPGAELLEPQEWRVQLREQLSGMASTYEP